ncbi:hypothetical protein [Brucella pituitosa]|uniref:hypothetical protein n=1 Tax=Brucella pituitosa TaxID=571256 RepID=UPI000CFEFA8A|nr:hypothetical protein CQ062_19445 [Ochrobactrum sp. MYb68]
MSKDNELLQREHFAVIVTTTTRVHHEGDERSRTHPGHGYPAYTEEIKSVDYIPFATADDVANWVKFRRASDARPYRIIKALPMRIETAITVFLTDGGSDADA